jgi:hypothetical protein
MRVKILTVNAGTASGTLSSMIDLTIRDGRAWIAGVGLEFPPDSGSAAGQWERPLGSGSARRTAVSAAR